jgi:NAD(P)-dependent dehydrogenase (short-subunit alcohol dehydrogenase family)
MDIAGSTVMVTGASRGLGKALVEEALARGAGRVYAAMRHPVDHPDPRVVPLALDVTDTGQIRAARQQVRALDVLVNNAGVGDFDDLGDRAVLERHLAVNLFGTYDVTQAFLPLLLAARGAIVNVSSLSAVAAVPVMPAYSVSKAAAFSLSQSLRALLAGRGVSVHAVLAGPLDTDMSRDLPIGKAAPGPVAAAVLAGLEKGEEEIFPDPLARTLADAWHAGPAKLLERQNAALLQARSRQRGPTPTGAG